MQEGAVHRDEPFVADGKAAVAGEPVVQIRRRHLDCERDAGAVDHNMLL